MSFLDSTPEVAALNQYWYSQQTIKALVDEIESGACGRRIAFLSTPSLYMSLKDEAYKENSVVFDYDTQWDHLPNFRFFDFDQKISSADLFHSFDCAVVDPPFITKDVWSKYVDAIKTLLVASGGRVILSTVGENEAFLRQELGNEIGKNLHKAEFMPAMHRAALPYQYSLFVNYNPGPDSTLSTWNSEIPIDFKSGNKIRM